MPIKGLSDKRRLPRLGKIRTGIKAKNDKGIEYPKAVDYFVCPPEVQKVHGEKPKSLPIIIPVEDEEKWASQYYRQYSRTRGLICKGDGETCTRMVTKGTKAIADKDSKEVEMISLPCKGRECDFYIAGKCGEVMNLQFMLPDVPGIGIWQIDTGSYHSIRNINSDADMIRAIYGRVSMIPLTLTIEPEGIQREGKKQDIHVLHLRTDRTLKELADAKNNLMIALTGVHTDMQIETPVPDDEAPEDTDFSHEPPSVELPEKVQAHVNNATPEELTAELYNAEKQAEVVKPEKKTAERLPASVTRVTELITAGFKDFDYQPREMLDILKIKTWPELAITPAEAYVQIKAHWLKNKGK